MIGKTVMSSKKQAPSYSLSGRMNIGSFTEDMQKAPGAFLILGVTVHAPRYINLNPLLRISLHPPQYISISSLVYQSLLAPGHLNDNSTIILAYSHVNDYS